MHLSLYKIVQRCVTEQSIGLWINKTKLFEGDGIHNYNYSKNSYYMHVLVRHT
jgi:hypothetical protein